MDSRTARIPSPWPWQAQVDGEEQRVSVQRSSSMAELLEALDLSDSTHEVAGRPRAGRRPGRGAEVWCDGRYESGLRPEWTAEQAQLFRYREQVRIRRFATVVD